MSTKETSSMKSAAEGVASGVLAAAVRDSASGSTTNSPHVSKKV